MIGLEVSSRAAAIARARGVREVRVASACEPLEFPRAAFDTVLLFGNNFGLCGTVPATARLLRELARVTKRHARIVATTRPPYHSAKGREVARFRLTYRGQHSKNAAVLLLTPQALAELAAENGWSVAEIFLGEEGYAVVLEKSDRATHGSA